MVLPALAVVVAPVGAVVAVHEMVVARGEDSRGEDRWPPPETRRRRGSPGVEPLWCRAFSMALREGDTPPSSAWYSQVLRWVALRV